MAALIRRHDARRAAHAANILLDDFDKELERRGHRFVRYADDFLVFTQTSQAARRVYVSVGRYLTRKLKLVVNQKKSRVGNTDGVEFLGYIFKGYGGQTHISPKNIQKFKDRVRQTTRRKRGVSIPHRCKELRQYFQGWVGYFSLIPHRSFFGKLDKWVRRRLRSCYWKQWRNPRTRITKLKQLGIRTREAILHGISSKGPWRMSLTEAMNFAITGEYLRKQGLSSLEELWHKFAPKRRTA